MRNFLGILVCAICLNATAKENQPNIIFIMTDDHAAHAIGAYGGRLADLGLTPNLDRLAAQGIRFENAFCSNSISFSHSVKRFKLGIERDTTPPK